MDPAVAQDGFEGSSPRKMPRVLVQNDRLLVPRMGTAITLVQVRKDGTRNPFPLVYCETARRYLATFGQPQFGVEVSMDNSISRYDATLNLRTHNILDRFEVDRQSFATLREVHEGKLEVVPESSEEGQLAIHAFSNQEGITLRNAAQALSQITFCLVFSEQCLFRIQIHDILLGNKLDLDVFEEDTVEDLKLGVEDEIGVPSSDQRFVFQGRVLQNHELLKNCGFSKHSVVCLITETGSRRCERKDSPWPHQQEFSVKTNKRFNEHQHECQGLGERGIVLLREVESEYIPCRRFKRGRSTCVKPFIVEFRYLNEDSAKF